MRKMISQVLELQITSDGTHSRGHEHNQRMVGNAGKGRRSGVLTSPDREGMPPSAPGGRLVAASVPVNPSSRLRAASRGAAVVAGRQASAAAPSGAWQGGRGRGRWTVVRTTAARASRLASDGHGGLDLVDPEGSGEINGRWDAGPQVGAAKRRSHGRVYGKPISFFLYGFVSFFFF